MIESINKRNKKFMTSNNCEIVILSQSLKRIKILSSGPLKGINGGNRASSETARLNYKKRCLPRIASRLTVPSLLIHIQDLPRWVYYMRNPIKPIFHS